jgi:hypothetical protein
MLPNHNSAQLMVKLEEMDSTEEKALLRPFTYPYFIPVQ